MCSTSADDHVMGLEKVLQRSQRVIKNSIEIESLELNGVEDVADIFDLDNKASIIGQEAFDILDELMRIFEMRKYAASDDGVRLAVFLAIRSATPASKNAQRVSSPCSLAILDTLIEGSTPKRLDARFL